MVELFSDFFEMLCLAKSLHDSDFSADFHDRCGEMSLDSDMCYELAYEAMSLPFQFTYEDYNQDYEFDVWVFSDPCIDRFCRLCLEYETMYGLPEKENPYRQEIERIIRDGFEFPCYSYSFDWYFSATDRGRKRLLLFTGMEFTHLTSVPVRLLDIREGFDALNLRLAVELGGIEKILQVPVMNAEAEWKEAA